MANLGNVGLVTGRGLIWVCDQFYTRDKQPGLLLVQGVSDTPNGFIQLIRDGTVQETDLADGSGNFSFGVLEDSLNQNYALATYTQAGATGEAWDLTISGLTYVLTKRFSSVRAIAVAFA